MFEEASKARVGHGLREFAVVRLLTRAADSDGSRDERLDG
jgi:hypothetical protein